MSETKWTAGPWRYERGTRDEDSGYFTASINSDEGGVLFHEAGWELTEPDAHLIVAAPDLFDALKAMLNSHGMHGPCEMNSCADCRRSYDKAKDAMRRARGEEGS